MEIFLVGLAIFLCYIAFKVIKFLFKGIVYSSPFWLVTGIIAIPCFIIAPGWSSTMSAFLLFPTLVIMSLAAYIEENEAKGKLRVEPQFVAKDATWGGPLELAPHPDQVIHKNEDGTISMTLLKVSSPDDPGSSQVNGDNPLYETIGNGLEMTSSDPRA
jgi:hypothetical protein